MFKIGDFSRLTRVSVKMLRHYDEVGLLKPAYVEPASGYRYYTPAQLPTLNRLIALKDLGFSLEQIATLLAEDLSLDELRGMLRLRRAEIADRIYLEQRRLAQIEAHLRQIEHATQPPRYDVVLRGVPAQLIASIRRVVPDLDTSVAQLFDIVEGYVARYRARAALSPLMLYHDPDYREAGVDIEVAIPLTEPIPPGDSVAVRELLGEPMMACVVYIGDYERLTEVLNALLHWIAANDYIVAGPFREVYLQFQATRAFDLNLPPAFLTDRTADFVTEVQIPVTSNQEHHQQE